MRLRSLSSITLWAVKFDEVRKLYRDNLGLPVSEDKPSFILFNTLGSRLAFHRLPKGSTPTRLTAELHFEVGDVDEIFQGLRERGVKFETPPTNRPWGKRNASFRDPEGYRVELIGPLRPGELAKGS